MTDLAAWLLEQITEDERRAKAMAAEYPTPWDLADRGWMARVAADGPHFHEVVRVEQHQVSEGVDWLGGVIQHVETWNPDRVLAECGTKRKLVEFWSQAYQSPADADRFSGPDWDRVRENAAWTLRKLAEPYRERSGYRTEWRP